MSQLPDPAEDRNVWFATVRPDGRPHLVPVWYVLEGDRWYVCMQANSVKARNLQANSAVSLALEDGNNPFVVEGQAQVIAKTPSVAEKFKAKYDWDIMSDDQYSQLVEVSVSRRLLGGSSGMEI